jgi:hypothetical protein
MNRLTTLAIFALTMAAVAPAAEAANESEAWKKDRFYIGLGLYRPNIDTRVRVDDAITGIGGTLLNFEKDLNLSDRQTEFMLDAHFRFAKRHAVAFEYVKLSRNSDFNIGFAITYDGETFAINEDVTSTFETEVARLGYQYSFINNEKMELSATIGLHVTDLKVGMNLASEDAEFNEITAPLPAIGGTWTYHFNDQWAFKVHGEWLDIKIDSFSGALTAALAEVSWYPTKHFGLSLGYNVWDHSASATKHDLTGRIDYKYDGPKLTLKTRF